MADVKHVAFNFCGINFTDGGVCGGGVAEMDKSKRFGFGPVNPLDFAEFVKDSAQIGVPPSDGQVLDPDPSGHSMSLFGKRHIWRPFR
jgi:hypothetical protein